MAQPGLVTSFAAQVPLIRELVVSGGLRRTRQGHCEGVPAAVCSKSRYRGVRMAGQPASHWPRQGYPGWRRPAREGIGHGYAAGVTGIGSGKVQV